MDVAILNRRVYHKTSPSRQLLIFVFPNMKLLKPLSNPNTKSNKNNYNQNNHTKRSLKHNKYSEQLPNTRANEASKTAKKSSCGNLKQCSTARLGSEPKLTYEKRVTEPYAGSSMSIASPAPNSVPFPYFFTKKFASTNPNATCDLHRLLRLEH